MRTKFMVGLVGVAVFALLAPGMAGATSTPITITSSTGIPNRVGDNETPLAHDGNLETGTYTTPSSTITDPAYLAFGFASTPVNRIRLFKNNEYGPHDLTIQYSTGTEALADRTWTTVSNLANGYLGTELLTATSVNSNGTVTADVHVSPANEAGATGWASLRFATVTATGIRIAFTKTGCCNHYRVFEFEAHYSLSTTIAVGSSQATPTSTSPVRFDVTFADPVTGFTGDDVVLTGTASTGTVVATDTGDGANYTIDVPVTSDGTVIASIQAGVAMANSVGNLASGSASITFDDTDPVLGAVNTSLRGPKVSATFSATDATPVTFQCKIDSASYTACTSPYVVQVPAGPHTFHVLATDAVGNSSAGQSSFTVKSKKIRP